MEIKYRRKDIIRTMARLDKQFAELQAKLKASGLSADERKSIETQLAAREEFLSSTFHQVAVDFADLHDTPGRMQKKGCVSVSVEYHFTKPSSIRICGHTTHIHSPPPPPTHTHVHNRMFLTGKIHASSSTGG